MRREFPSWNTVEWHSNEAFMSQGDLNPNSQRGTEAHMYWLRGQCVIVSCYSEERVKEADAVWVNALHDQVSAAMTALGIKSRSATSFHRSNSIQFLLALCEIRVDLLLRHLLAMAHYGT